MSEDLSLREPKDVIIVEAGPVGLLPADYLGAKDLDVIADVAFDMLYGFEQIDAPARAILSRDAAQ